MNDDTSGKTQKEVIRAAYSSVAEGGRSSCCGGSSDKELGIAVGYSIEEVEGMPDDALLGLSCGNPLAEAGLQRAEVVLDLGSGGGHDVLLASRQVGPRGKVIGVDMTAAMVQRAREMVEEMGLQGVEFHLSEIEALPVDDASVDVVISNCVINLSPDKPQVFSEINRVLKPGGRMAISDIVLTRELPERVLTSPEALVACVAGAATLDEYLAMIEDAGLELKRVTSHRYELCFEPDSSDPLVREVFNAVADSESLHGVAVSVTILAMKPEG